MRSGKSSKFKKNLSHTSQWFIPVFSCSNISLIYYKRRNICNYIELSINAYDDILSMTQNKRLKAIIRWQVAGLFGATMPLSLQLIGSLEYSLSTTENGIKVLKIHEGIGISNSHYLLAFDTAKIYEKHSLLTFQNYVNDPFWRKYPCGFGWWVSVLAEIEMLKKNIAFYITIFLDTSFVKAVECPQTKEQVWLSLTTDEAVVPSIHTDFVEFKLLLEHGNIWNFSWFPWVVACTGNKYLVFSERTPTSSPVWIALFQIAHTSISKGLITEQERDSTTSVSPTSVSSKNCVLWLRWFGAGMPSSLWK